MTRIVTLQFNAAVEAIKHCKTVFYKQGVWNRYKKVDVSTAIKGIERSGYGADVYTDEKTGDYYVSVPCDSDMW